MPCTRVRRHLLLVRARGVPVRRGNGAIHEWVSVFTDIDKQHQGEEESRRTVADLLDFSRASKRQRAPPLQ